MRCLVIVVLGLFIHGVDARAGVEIQNTDTLNQVNSEGARTGWWLFYYNDGKIKEEGLYSLGHKQGVWKAYYPDGTLKHEITFEAGTARGPARFFREDGTLWEEGFWNQTCWVGDYSLYHANGKKACEWHYNQRGRRSGSQKYYHPNGRIKYQGTWENGHIADRVEVYNEAGELTEMREYNNGTFNKREVAAKASLPQNSDKEPGTDVSPFHGTGNHTIYHMDGKIEKKGYFRDGYLYNGKHFLYNQNDSLIEVRKFENGLLQK